MLPIQHCMRALTLVVVSLLQVIEQNGGDVDTTSYSNRVTHVMCENQESDVFQLVCI